MIHVLEAVIASIVMISFVAVMASVYMGNAYPVDMSARAYDILDGIDNRELLRNYTENLNYTGIGSEIESYTYFAGAQICDYAGSCVGSMPDSGNVWTGTYLVAGLQNYQPREVRVYIWPM
jgi:hypothetical protein